MCAAKILFELSGSIAAWKACAVISRLVQDGHEVQTVATAGALRFVGAATLEGLTGRAVKSDLWETGAAMDHINLVKWADLVVLCPATANTLSRLAAGLADDLVGALFLAHDWRKPFLVAPAMNPAMWAHPATAAAVGKLQGWGVRFLPVGRGRLACGDEGEGRLLEPDVILEHLRAVMAAPVAGAALTKPVSAPPGRRILITSGGTEEPIDGVRTLGNFSTGRTGALLADGFAAAGHEVTLLRSRRAMAPTASSVHQAAYTTFADLESALRTQLARTPFDFVVHAAAVGDYSVAGLVVDGEERAAGNGKLSSGHEVAIRLRPNAKLVDQLRAWSANPRVQIVAFKLTRGAGAIAARTAVEKLFAHSRADFVVHNDLAQLDEASGRFPATIITAAGAATPVTTRAELAAALVRLLADPADVSA